jgi:hypothetical protein
LKSTVLPLVEAKGSTKFRISWSPPEAGLSVLISPLLKTFLRRTRKRKKLPSVPNLKLS